MVEWDGVTFPAPEGVVVETPMVVAAVGIGVSHNMGDDLHDRIETAMREACESAQAAGVTDPDEIRDRMLAARDAVLGG
jgi:hypothetical protein